MIDKDQIAEAARYVDAGAEEHGVLTYLRSLDVDPEGAMYVAMQLGLRVVMIEKGLSPNVTKRTGVFLTAEEQLHQAKYAGIYLDGLAVGLALARKGTRGL